MTPLTQAAALSAAMPGRDPMPEQAIRELVGHNLRQAREELRLTQADLANMAGVDPTVISAWERGRRLPSPRYLMPLAVKLGRTYGWFFLDHHDGGAA